MGQNKEIGEIKQETNLIQLDIKNQKILSILTANAKENASSIAKKVQLSKSNVIRRIKNLEEKKLLLGYHAYIDVSKLKINTCIVFVKINSLSNKKVYIKNLIENKQIYAITEIIGSFDLIIGFYYEENKDNILDLILNPIFVKKFKINEVITKFPKLKYIKINQDKKNQDKNNFNRYNKKELNITIDKIDYNILEILSDNCKLSTVDIAKIIKVPRETITYRIKKLENNKIIAKYQPNINYFMLNTEFFVITFKLNKPSMKHKIIHLLSDTKKFNTILDSLNDTEIIAFGNFTSMNDFRDFEQNIIELFNNSILEYSFDIGRCQHKLDWMPDKSLFPSIIN